MKCIWCFTYPVDNYRKNIDYSGGGQIFVVQDGLRRQAKLSDLRHFFNNLHWK